MLAPIVLFAFNRPNTLKRLIESLRHCLEAEQSCVYVFVDGPRSENDQEAIAEVLALLKRCNCFRTLHIEVAPANKGLAKSVIDGVTAVMQTEGRAIVLEDDLVVSPFFLTFMNQAIETYEHRNDIWSISAYTPAIELPQDYIEDVFLVPRAQCWGWASWKDRWRTIDWHPINTGEHLTHQERKQFDRGGNDLSRTLEMEAAGRIESWAVRWAYNASIQNRWTVNPIQSLVQNMGCKNSSAHRGWHDNRHHTTLASKLPTVAPSIEPDERILTAFKQHHDVGLVSRVGYFMRRYGLGYNWVKKTFYMGASY